MRRNAVINLLNNEYTYKFSMKIMLKKVNGNENYIDEILIEGDLSLFSLGFLSE